VEAAWLDWERGIPPTREWLGRGGQNPRLLAAFAALDRAKVKAEKQAQQQPPGLPRESREAFERRVRAQVQGGGNGGGFMLPQAPR
jgi:hypothetical protein